ncbi:MAG: hypothetical protein HQK51_18755, partial [Oligoflexia bacterium]|nr:hypothetical protein [Oligoflexia bacterium]
MKKIKFYVMVIIAFSINVVNAANVDSICTREGTTLKQCLNELKSTIVTMNAENVELQKQLKDENGFLLVNGNAKISSLYVGKLEHGITWPGIKSVNSPQYALIQSNDGKYTLMNKASGGGYLGFRVDNDNKMTIDDSGNLSLTGNATIATLLAGTLEHGSTWPGIKSSSSPQYALIQSNDGKYTLMNKASGGGYLGFRVDN